MISRFRARVRLGAETILVVAGIVFWTLAIVLPLTSLHIRLLTSLDQPERQSLPIIIGGASLAGGIMLLLAPRRRQRRTYYDEGENFSSLAHPSAPRRDQWAAPIARDGLRLVGTVTPPPSQLRDAQ